MLHLEPTPEPEVQISHTERRMNGNSNADPALSVTLPLSLWQRVANQLAEGKINQFLPVLTAIQQQVQDQLQPPRTEA